MHACKQVLTFLVIKPRILSNLQFYLTVMWHLTLVTWRRQWHPTPVLLPGKSHGRRSLKGCSSWGRWGSDTTERLLFHFSLSCIGEGNGNPLHCSCLENPRDGRAWWATVYGVAQSRTWLKRLSSSTSTTNIITLRSKDLIQIWQWNKKLYRQTKAKRIQQHQTSLTTNAKGTSLGRKHKRKQQQQQKDPQKQTQNN